MARYVEISESVFMDLIRCKSKMEDIKELLKDTPDADTRPQVFARLRGITFDNRYAEADSIS